MGRSPLLRLPPLLLLVFSSPLFLLVKGAGQGKLPNLEMTGQPTTSLCGGGGLNGVWVYQGRTADGKGYFKKDGGLYGDVYLYFDKNSDGGEDWTCSYIITTIGSSTIVSTLPERKTSTGMGTACTGRGQHRRTPLVPPPRPKPEDGKLVVILMVK